MISVQPRQSRVWKWYKDIAKSTGKITIANIFSKTLSGFLLLYVTVLTPNISIYSLKIKSQQPACMETGSVFLRGLEGSSAAGSAAVLTSAPTPWQETE